jgi:hypothetical protein
MGWNYGAGGQNRTDDRLFTNRRCERLLGSFDVCLSSLESIPWSTDACSVSGGKWGWGSIGESPTALARQRFATAAPTLESASHRTPLLDLRAPLRGSQFDSSRPSARCRRADYTSRESFLGHQRCGRCRAPSNATKWGSVGAGNQSSTVLRRQTLPVGRQVSRPDPLKPVPTEQSAPRQHPPTSKRSDAPTLVDG